MLHENIEHNGLLVVVVAYNSMRWAKKCYESLRNSNVSCDIITIDNGSTDGTQEFIRSNYPEVELIENDENIGFGKANNIGFKKALIEGYEYVYLLNQDAWVKPDTFEKLIEIAKKYPEYGVLSPMQMQANENQLDYTFRQWVVGCNQNHHPNLIDDMYNGKSNDVYEVDFVMAAHWLITRRCLETVGGFSPTFSHNGEDDNYLHRAKYWNFKVGIVPGCIAIHGRADRKETAERSQYISYYIQNLKALSNPLKPNSIYQVIRDNFVLSLLHRNRLHLNYVVRLFKERKEIKKNLQQSYGKCAFINLP